MNILMETELIVKGQGYAPMSICLSRHNVNGYVVHTRNLQDGGMYCGKYYMDSSEWPQAMAEFIRRATEELNGARPTFLLTDAERLADREAKRKARRR